MSTYPNTIAIIDDDEVFLLLMTKMIEHKKAADNILQFSNAVAAITYFINNATDTFQLPSVILLDLHMPEMNGWQFLQQLNRIKFNADYDPAAFIISGENIDFEKMRDYPLIKGYIAKPVIPDKLIEAIESVKIAY